VSLNAAAIAIMVERGLSAADILAVAEALEIKKDRTGAERQARYRDRKDVSENEWYYLREQVFMRDGYACTYCGSDRDLSCDHVVPLIQGGKSTLDNLTTACKPCNSGKGGRAPEVWLA
jgi:5-methylcytosine-specific restriction endonuclease McrA